MSRPSATTCESNPPADFSTTSAEELTRWANEFLEKEDLAEAYPALSELAARRQETLTVQMTAGLVALQLGRTSDAAMHFNGALAAAPDDFDANYNLALLDIAESRHRSALARFAHLRRLHPENLSLLNDIAVVWAERKKPARALGAFSRALRLGPNDSRTRNNAMQFCLEHGLVGPAGKMLQRQEQCSKLTAQSHAEIHRWKEILNEFDTVEQETAPSEDSGPTVMEAPQIQVVPLKIAFFASHRAFVRDIMTFLSAENEVRLFEGSAIEEMKELLTWADVAWFEWCDNYIIEAAKLAKSCKIVCRLHSYEAFTDMPSKVDWSKVDHLVFVNQSVLDLFRRQIKAPVSTTVIHNGVDLDRFAIEEDKRISKKIASVGYINYKKNPSLLLYCFKKIHEYDPGYTLHIAGQHQDSRIELYFDHFLRENRMPVCFDGWVENMPAWYADKDFVISTSLFESFHYSIAEGMACGLMPLIHNWYGARNIYPSRFLFNDPDDCLRLLTHLEKEDRRELAQQNRKYICDRYNLAEKQALVSQLLNRLVRSDTAASPVPGDS